MQIIHIKTSDISYKNIHNIQNYIKRVKIFIRNNNKIKIISNKSYFFYRFY